MNSKKTLGFLITFSPSLPISFFPPFSSISLLGSDFCLPFCGLSFDAFELGNDDLGVGECPSFSAPDDYVSGNKAVGVMDEWDYASCTFSSFFFSVFVLSRVLLL